MSQPQASLARSRRWRRRLAPKVCLSLVLPMIVAISMGGVATGFERYGLFIIGLGLVVAFHEFGHFIAAKACGVKCEVFSLGIGPRMVGWQKGVGFSFGKQRNESAEKNASGGIGAVHPDMEMDPSGKRSAPVSGSASGAGSGSNPGSGSAASGPATAISTLAAPASGTLTTAETSRDESVGRTTKMGETDYRISWFPLGGYVRMLGQDDMDPTKISEDPRSFNRKSIPQRMIIISAGVVMNLVFAMLVFMYIFRIGVKFPQAYVGDIAFNSPAQKAGLHVGDLVTSINGSKPHGFLEWQDFRMAAALGQVGQPVHITYVGWKHHRVHQVGISPVMSPESNLLSFGAGAMVSLQFPNWHGHELREFYKEFPRFKGLKPNDRIVAINGHAVTVFPQLYQRLQKANGRPVVLTLKNKNPKIGVHKITVPTYLELRPWVKHLPTIAGMFPRTALDMVLPGSPAAKAGLKAGDVILRIDATAHPTVQQFRAAIKGNDNQVISLVVLRHGKRLTFHATPKTELGVAPTYDFAHPVVAAATGKLRGKVAPNSKIIAVLIGKRRFAVNSWSQIVTLIRKHPGAKAQFVFARGQRPVQVAFNKHVVADANKFMVKLNLPLEPEMGLQRSHTIWGAASMGMTHTIKWVAQTYQTFWGLAKRTIPFSKVHGAVGMAKYAYDIESRGFTYLLFFLALISVNLAVVNFLPLPIVDGGLFALLLLEGVRGKPLSLRVQSAIQIVGVVLLVSLFLYITIFNDFRLFHF